MEILPANGVLLDHAPPGVASLSDTDAPTHRLVLPLMATGDAVTVIDLVCIHPVPSEYVIVVTPVAIPVTSPLSEPAVPAAGLLLTHTPPGTPSLSVTVLPTHTVDAPSIVVGEVLTVIVLLAVQPVGNV